MDLTPAIDRWFAAEAREVLPFQRMAWAASLALYDFALLTRPRAEPRVPLQRRLMRTQSEGQIGQA